MLFLSLQALIKPSKNKRLRNVIALCALLTPIYALANDHFSSWSDKTICRLAKATPDNIEYQAELTKRGLSCGDAVTSSSKTTTTASSGNIKKNFQVDANSSHTLQFRDVHVDRRALGSGWHAAISYLDLDDDGDTDIFISAVSNVNKSKASEVYLNDGLGSFALEKYFFANPPGQVHPRKSITGDFNGDGKEDIYLAGHGWDQPPFPGEAPVLILSSATGYTSSILDEFSGFQHGAASADIDADGDLDIVVSNIKSKKGVAMLLNDGSGSFVLSSTKLRGFNGRGGYFTVELVDVDQDGYVDLLLAGHEMDGANSAIFWGSELGDYSYWNNKTILSKVQGFGVVVDIDVGDIDNDGDKDIILNRTGSDNGKFYNGYHIQILKNNGDRSFSQFDSIISSPEENWFDWVRLVDMNNDGNLDIVADDAQINLIWINSGSGSFSKRKEEAPVVKTGIEGWSDTSVCAWVKSSKGGHPKPLAEAKKRGLSCNNGASKN
jgi:hypothetical protein